MPIRDARKKQKAAATFSMATASESFGQPLDCQYCPDWFPQPGVIGSAGDALVLAPVELYLLFRYLRDDGKAVLNAQSFNLSVPQVGTKTNELQPRGR